MTLSEAQSKIEAILDLLEMSENIVVTGLEIDTHVGEVIIRPITGRSIQVWGGWRRLTTRVTIETE
jgi:hypothetical protein